MATDDFHAVATALPELVVPLEPIAEQWDRLSDCQCYMLMLPGPTKVDLIFDEPHDDESPWEPGPEMLAGIDSHFWDWVLWLVSKEAAGKGERVAVELEKLFEHLLRPMGAREVSPSLRAALELYERLRDELEKRFAAEVPRRLEREVSPVVWRASS